MTIMDEKEFQFYKFSLKSINNVNDGNNKLSQSLGIEEFIFRKDLPRQIYFTNMKEYIPHT